MAARVARIVASPDASNAIKEAPPSRSEKISTKDKILDAAEELFSIYGYYGVSLRDITRLAGVELALANYHFGPKEELFGHVIARRAGEHCGDIIASLDEAFAKTSGRPPTIEGVIEAFVRPVFKRLLHDGPEWHSYIRLLAQVSQLRHQQEFLLPLHKLYNPVVRRFLTAIQTSLPSCTEEGVYWAYYFIYGSLLHILVANGDIDKVSHGSCRSTDYEEISRRFIPFFAAAVYRMLDVPDAALKIS